LTLMSARWALSIFFGKKGRRVLFAQGFS
jgi:hypothetical protein